MEKLTAQSFSLTNGLGSPRLSLVDHALTFAAFAHRHQTRKGTEIPYIVHPYAVGLKLQRAGCTDEVVAAGILHDVIEDTPVTIENLRMEFGARVAEIVAQCSEPDRSLPWEKRKEHTITFLRTAPFEVKLVAAADKLDNLRGIMAEHDKIGEQVWARFKRGREQQAWYYHSVAESLLQNLTAGSDRTIFLELQTEAIIFFAEAF